MSSPIGRLASHRRKIYAPSDRNREEPSDGREFMVPCLVSVRGFDLTGAILSAYLQIARRSGLQGKSSSGWDGCIKSYRASWSACAGFGVLPPYAMLVLLVYCNCG